MRRIDRGDLGRTRYAIAAGLPHARLLPGGTMACIAATAKSLLIALDCRAMDALSSSVMGQCNVELMNFDACGPAKCRRPTLFWVLSHDRGAEQAGRACAAGRAFPKTGRRRHPWHGRADADGYDQALRPRGMADRIRTCDEGPAESDGGVEQA